MPALAREVLAGLLDQFHDFDTRVAAYDRQIRALAKVSEPARRLMQVKAIGPQTATALVASMGDPHVFKSGRSYAASLGITPRQHSSGGIDRLGQITRQGDSYVRTLLVHGARARSRQCGGHMMPVEQNRGYPSGGPLLIAAPGASYAVASDRERNKTDRHRGRGHPRAPATPPDMRIPHPAVRRVEPSINE